MNVHAEAARLRANRLGNLLDEGLDYAKKKGAEVLDDGTSRLAQEAKDHITEEYGEAAGNIAGAALEGVQEEYFSVEGKKMDPALMASVIRRMNIPQVSRNMNHGLISPKAARTILKHRATLTKGVGSGVFEKSKMAAQAQEAAKAEAASNSKRNWIIGLSAVGVVGVATTVVVLANKKKKV